MRKFSVVMLLAYSMLLMWDYASAGELRGHVVSVSDGDTFSVLTAEKRQYVIRLANVDAPETSCHQFNAYAFEHCVDKSQPFGKASKRSLSNLIFDKDVVIATAANVEHHALHDVDVSYNRIIGTVYVGETDINYEQVRLGYAWHEQGPRSAGGTHAPAYAKRQQTREAFEAYAAAEVAARNARVGLWADTSAPVPPWVFRHRVSDQ